MATEKTILTVDLYDNVLTEKPGDYAGKVRITGTLHNKEIAARIVAKRTEYRHSRRQKRCRWYRTVSSEYRRPVRREKVRLQVSG